MHFPVSILMTHSFSPKTSTTDTITDAVRNTQPSLGTAFRKLLRQSPILCFQLSDQFDERPVLIPQMEDLLDLLRAY
jgi:hypothetical protein